MLSLLWRSAFLLACLLLASACHAREFQNLDFEGTTFDFESWLQQDPNATNEAEGDQQAIIPGWSLRNESADRELLSQPTFDRYPGSLLRPHLSDAPLVQFFPPQAESSPPGNDYGLELIGGFSYSFPEAGGDFVREPVHPTAFQTGMVPETAKSVLIRGGRYANYFWDVEPSKEHPDGIDVRYEIGFSVMFNGFRVDLKPVDATQYPDVVDEYYPGPPPEHEYNYWAGNIEPIAGLERELAIRPETMVNHGNPYFAENTRVAFTSIYFSTSPTSGIPVRVPAPGCCLLSIGVLAFCPGWRHRARV